MRPFLIACVAAVLTACAAPTERPSSTGADIDRVLAEAEVAARAPSEPPAAVVDALMPPPSGLGPEAAPEVEPRFDLNVNAQSARAFFMGLVRGTRYNMVVHPDVAGSVSLSLKNVTIPEVMVIARDVYGYEFQENRSGYMVLPAQVRSRVFEVDYLNVKRSGSSRTRVSSGQSTENPQAMMQPGYGGLGAVGQVGGNQGQQDRETLSGSSVETESEADFWPLLKTTLEAMVGTGEGRGVIINPQTGTVVVRAMPAELRQVAEYIAMVQDSAQRMVIIDAKIIEVELRDGYESGINWAAIGRDGTRTITGGVLRGRDLFSDNTSPLAGRTIPTTSGNPLPNLDAEGFGGVFGIGIDTTDFDAFIELLQTQGRTQVLSSPRTTAVNNQKAVIKVGNDEYFVTSIGSQTTTGTATNTSSQIQLTPFFSGIALDVTPQISADGEVILHIQPTVSEVTDQTKTFTVSGRTESVPLAFSSVRQSDSIVRARSGQVVVIGGLMRSASHDDSAGAPGLADIPGLGALFRHDRQRERKSELVILLQPTIVDDSTWQEELSAQQERLRSERP